ncbi:hypothetical protein OPIT5_10125 [Opitutaceae bacterium TAV5]|nr:hypothetical protein OPIT5_10125 [Opitutaceae bacterium TAV5]
MPGKVPDGFSPLDSRQAAARGLGEKRGLGRLLPHAG